MTHREIFELLPWYANATLEDAERREIEQHLSGCAECARELEALRAVQAAAIELAEEAPAPSPALLGKTLAEIERWERNRSRPRLARLAEWFQGWWLPAPAFARAVMVAQFALIVALAAFLWLERRPEAEYTTLTGTAPPAGEVHFTVGFQPGATEASIREALAAVNGQIVSGPSALGLYTVRVSAPADPNAVAGLLQRLRERSEVVRIAELAR